MGDAARHARRARADDRAGRWRRGPRTARLLALMVMVASLDGCTDRDAGVVASREAQAPSGEAAGAPATLDETLPATIDRSAALDVARDIMRVARYAALITRDAAGESAARTIDPAPPDSAMVVRFVTNPRSRKVGQLAADARVTLYYFDAAAQRYATLYGRARLVIDSAERRARWYDGWTPFYPERERGANLYEVVPDRLEVVSPGDGVIGDSLTWATPTLRFAPPTARP